MKAESLDDGKTARRWTPSQRRGIETIDTSVLVSAAAGSGKTSVLAERCAHLICDGKNPCAVDELLVVTFTEAAAAEMKGRIHKAIAERAAKSNDPHVLRQLAMVDSAQVGTLHGFCAQIVRQHFHRLGVDPGFVIIDADESALMKRDVAREIIGEWFDREDCSATLAALVDAYGDGDDERIATIVLRLHELLSSLVDPAAWIARSLARLKQAAEKPLIESELGQQYMASLERDLLALRNNCADAGKALAADKRFPIYVEHLRELYSVIQHWIKVLKTGGPDALAEESILDLPKMPPVSTKLEGREPAKKRVDDVRTEMKTGDWRKGARFTQAQWAEGLLAILPHTRLLLELVEDFAQQYAATKRDAGGLDFSDLERLALTALVDEASPLSDPKPSGVAKYYQDQFRHVLVDEYQDINQLQDTILSLLSRQRRSTEVPNLFCVGDVKQSIYRFRLADPELFRGRREQYTQQNDRGVVIDLQENFRSRAALLTAINGVFGRLMTAEAAELNYDASHELRPGATFPEGDGGRFDFAGAPIELHVVTQDGPIAAATSEEGETQDRGLDRTQREGAVIAGRILEMMGKRATPPMRVADRGPDGKSIMRPIRFGDIAILLRSMQFKADDLVESLRNAGIPVHSQTTTGYFEATEINDVLSLLAVLDNAAQDIPLAALLRSPLAMLPHAEDALARIRLAYPDEPFHAAVSAYRLEQRDKLAEQLGELWRQLDQWRKMIRRRPLAEVLWSIYDQSGFLAFCAGLPGGEQRQANLIELHERARQFGTFRRQGLSRFLQFLEKLKTESDLGQAPVMSAADDVVRVMSIHRSKGLEFPVVFVADLGKKLNFGDAEGSVLIDRCSGIGLQVLDVERRVRYPSLAWAVLHQRLRQQTIAEELRVLYVAMTRAKEHLVLVGTARAEQPDKWAAQWRNHAGPLPAADVLAGRTALDWLGPVAAAAGEEQIRVMPHSAADVDASLSTTAASQEKSDRLNALAALQPLAPEPPVPVAARQTMERLCQRYPFQQLTRTAASSTVTALAKPPHAAISTESAPPSPLEPLLPNPQFFSGRLITPVERGNATHLALQYLNFGRAGDRTAINGQLQAMVQSGRLAPEFGAEVDLDAIQWLLGEGVGKLLISNENRLMREVPVTFLQEASGAGDEPADRVMIRGRLDVLIPIDNELVIVDYKTDRVRGEALTERANQYRDQLNWYRRAIEPISGRKVRESFVVFLHARQCVGV